MSKQKILMTTLMTVLALVLLLDGMRNAAHAETIWSYDGKKCVTPIYTQPITSSIPLDISDTFGPRVLKPENEGRYDFHRGLDWPVPISTTVYAVADGEVMDVKDDWGSGVGSGNYVLIYHAQFDCETYYAHLSSVSVAIGDEVDMGDEIGKSGKTGATYPHLHFEVRLGSGGTSRAAINPLDTLFIPWQNVAAPQVEILGTFPDTTGLTTLVQVTSPEREPDLAQVAVTIPSVGESKVIDYVELNAATTVKARLDDPQVDDVCIMPYDLDSNGYRIVMAFRHLNYAYGSTVNVSAKDVDAFSSVAAQVVKPGAVILPAEQEAMAVPGETVALNFTLTNPGPDTAVYNLALLSAQKWTKSLSVPQLTLAAGGSGSVTASITVDYDKFGPSDCGLLIATPQAGSQPVIAAYYRIHRQAYVDSSNGSNNNDGSMNAPFLTIQYGITNTVDGGIVHVAQGTYTETLALKNTIDLLGGYAPDWLSRSFAENATTVRSNVTTQAVLEISGDHGPLVEGFTFTNGNNDKAGGGIRIVGGAAATIRHNWIVGNQATSGGGIFVSDTGFLPPIIQSNRIFSNTTTSYDGGGIWIKGRPAVVENNIFRGNTAQRDGHGLAVTHNSNATIIHNTLAGNTTHTGIGLFIQNGSEPTVINNLIVDYGAAAFCDSSAVTLENTFVWDVANISGCGHLGTVFGPSGVPTPLLLTLDYHLAVGSPAINVGQNSGVLVDIDGEARPHNNTLPDIGADESPY